MTIIKWLYYKLTNINTKSDKKPVFTMMRRRQHCKYNSFPVEIMNSDEWWREYPRVIHSFDDRAKSCRLFLSSLIVPRRILELRGKNIHKLFRKENKLVFIISYFLKNIVNSSTRKEIMLYNSSRPYYFVKKEKYHRVYTI